MLVVVVPVSSAIAAIAAIAIRIPMAEEIGCG